jgi:hypothetical protein
VQLALLIYAAGVAAGLVFTDARPAGRLALALLWPIGPLAFVVTITTLLLAALVIFPVVGGLVAAGAVGAWWALG